MVVLYPVLAGEIAKRGIKKATIAKQLGISNRTLYNKLYGLADFTWTEVLEIRSCFFPDIDPQLLFSRVDQDSA